MEIKKLKVSELRAKAEELGLSNYEKLKKADLVRIITKALKKAIKEEEKNDEVVEDEYVDKRVFNHTTRMFTTIKIKK